jgi:hypothetical protein
MDPITAEIRESLLDNNRAGFGKGHLDFPSLAMPPFSSTCSGRGGGGLREAQRRAQAGPSRSFRSGP